MSFDNLYIKNLISLDWNDSKFYPPPPFRYDIIYFYIYNCLYPSSIGSDLKIQLMRILEFQTLTNQNSRFQHFISNPSQSELSIPTLHFKPRPIRSRTQDFNTSFQKFRGRFPIKYQLKNPVINYKAFVQCDKIFIFPLRAVRILSSLVLLI